MSDTTTTERTCNICLGHPADAVCRNCGRDICAHCGETCGDCGLRMCPDCGYRCVYCDRALCQYCVNYPFVDDAEYHDPDEPFCRKCVRTQVGKRADYQNPYWKWPTTPHLTIGLEIEIDGEHDHKAIAASDLIAGWSRDGSLGADGWEYQTQPLTTDPATIDRLRDLVGAIEPHASQEDAGGHIHVTRTIYQTADRWLNALKGLDKERAEWLNMRHAGDDNRWCKLNPYCHGKTVAVNDDHDDTIELRTFGPWNADTVYLLRPAVDWIRIMWRFFQNHPGPLHGEDIQATSRTAWRTVAPTNSMKQGD